MDGRTCVAEFLWILRALINPMYNMKKVIWIHEACNEKHVPYVTAHKTGLKLK
jgi:phage terminase large subunit-like protein